MNILVLEELANTVLVRYIDQVPPTVLRVIFQSIDEVFYLLVDE